ncbi:SpoIIE family protein phosphatase [bacterium]|nr:SpoIIE family protein phosphatase [bacterium]
MTERKPTFLFSLRFKIAIPFVIMVFTIMASVTYIFTIREMTLRSEQVKLRMERLANNIATIRSVGSEDWELYQSYIENQISINPDIVYIAIFNEFRDLKASTLNMNWIDIPSRILSSRDQALIIGQLEQGRIADDSQRDFESVSVNIMMGNQSRGYVHVGFSKVEINDELRRNLIANLALGFLFTIAAIFISFYMSQKIVNPLMHLTRAMKQITQGNFNQHVPIRTNDEIGEMTETFNFMTNGLREKVEIESFGRELGFTLEAERIFSLITQRIGIALHSKQTLLFLRNNESTCELALVSTFPDEGKTGPVFHCSEKLHTLIKSTDNPKPLSHFDDFPEFGKHLSGIGSLHPGALICPIKVMDDIVGILMINGCQSGEVFQESDIVFLGTLIRQAGFALENVLLIDELTEKERMKQELKIAGEVQQSLLPNTHPGLNGYDIHGICLPATEIGGDYFDYFHIDESRLGLVIADVTGKGTSAAFYMAMVKGLMLALVERCRSPKHLLCTLNRRLYGIMDRRIFITMIYAVIDKKQHTLTFSRAGHNSLIVKDNRTCSVDCRIPEGIGLGLEKGDLFDENIHEETIHLKQFHTILFYTDGIVESQNPEGEEFGENRLVELLKKTDQASSEAVNNTVIEAVKNFVNGQAQFDDMTLITVTGT